MFTKVRAILNEYNKPFWVLILATFVDRFGGYVLFPFYALYITDHFNVGMTEVGILFMMLSIGGLLGGVIGGALSDKIGRKRVILIGLIFSGFGSIIMGITNDLLWFYIFGLVLGILGDMGGPARQAMLIDLVPNEKQTDGFGILRVAINIAATIGPIFGGFIASNSFFLLFVADAVFSAITAGIVIVFLPETKPTIEEVFQEKSILQSMKGYGIVFRDRPFIAFLFMNMIMIFVYLQMYSTLSVYLRDFHSFTPTMLGMLLSLNAIMVVFLQIPITRKISKFSQMKMMALGTMFYGIGFAMYGIVSITWLFYLAMGIITIGEMITTPVGHALAASFSPEDKRGRYMAVFGFSWAIPNLFGVLVAGSIMDNYNPNFIWFGAGVISLLTIIGFLVLALINRESPQKQDEINS